MASISELGIGCSVLMLGLATSPLRAATQPPPPPRGSASIDVTIRGLGNDRGVVRLALCPAGSPFPECGAVGVKQTLAIHGGTATTTLAGIVPGTYAIAVFHDENSNGRLDTFMGIPREGFGFSNNPPLHPRAPKFSECQFAVATNVVVNISIENIL